MAWRCCDCGYYGENAVSNEEYDEACPDCGAEVYPYEYMTEEQDRALDSFIEDNIEHLLCPEAIEVSLEDDDLIRVFFWDDFAQVKEKLAELKNKGIEHYVYTVVECDDDEAWLTDGWHYVNRMGYYISTQKIVIPEEGLRYW